MTVETAIWNVLDAGARLDVEGDRLILDVPDEATAARIPAEAVAVLKAHKGEALGIVRRMRERGPVAVACRCGCCDTSFPYQAPGASWTPCPDGGSWPLCPECATERPSPRGTGPPPPLGPSEGDRPLRVPRGAGSR